MNAGAAARILVFLNENERHTVDHQHGGDDGRVMQVRVHPVVKRNADERAGQNRHDDLNPEHDGLHFKQTDKPFALLRLFERPEFGEIQHDDRQNRAELDDHLEHRFERVGHLQLDELIQQNHVPRGADGQPFGDALHDAEKQSFQRLDEKIHKFLLFWGFAPNPAKNLRFLDFPPIDCCAINTISV